MDIYRREYGGQRFDDMILAAFAGPQLLLPRSRASLLLKADRRWSALQDESNRWSAKPVSRGLGPRLEGGLRLGARGGWQRSRAQRPDLRSRTRRIGGFIAADLPPVLGVTGLDVAFFHDLLFTRFDEPGALLITPDAREDRTSITRLSASNDHIELFGFVPALSLVHERRSSNVAEVFDYRRNRAEITMQRRF